MNQTLIKNITLITGKEKEPIENASIAIDNNSGKIIAIGTNTSNNNNFNGSNSLNASNISKNQSNYKNIIDGEGKFLMPGFIDAHVHIMANGFLNEDTMNNPFSYYFYNALKNMKDTLDAGITTVRDCGLADIGTKLAAERRLFPSPKLHISVVPLSITGGHFDFYLNSGYDMIQQYKGFPHPVCNGKEGVLQKTREVLRAKADFIKIMATGGVISANDAPNDIQFSAEEIKIAVDEADRIGGKKVATHCHGLGGIKTSLKAGVHSIEHGSFIEKPQAKEMAEKGIFLVPTFSVIKLQKDQASKNELAADKIPKALEVAKVHQENMEMAYEEGVTMVMGTDAGIVEHGKNLGELQYLTNLGMTPMEAIIAGTFNSAKCLGIENKTGSIEVGKIADLIITEKDPLENISILSSPNNILFIMQNGKVVKNNLNS
ncbi:MAG: amidohydrolase family protein [Methanobrevibacter sp.]|jgi:imidazolonepropionase-like amidohydrolase|nr:amidohydrolase family protein [Methanobrevibacter sp.]